MAKVHTTPYQQQWFYKLEHKRTGTARPCRPQDVTQVTSCKGSVVACGNCQASYTASY